MKHAYLIIMILITFQIFSFDKILYPEDIISLLSTNNHTIKISESSSNLAKTIYDQVINSSKPTISFTTDAYDTPFISYNNYTADTDTYSLSGGLNLSQALPTGGTLSLTINESFDFQIDDNEDMVILQTPGIDLSIYQPIFINNKFIDFSNQKNAQRSSNITYNISKIDEADTKNQIIIGVLTSIHSVNIMRSSITLLNKNLEIAEKKVIMGKEDRDRGRISSSELLNLELNVAKQNDALFNMRYQLKIAEINLERVLGLDDLTNIEFDLKLFKIPNLEDSISSNNNEITPNEYKASLLLEQQELNLKLNSLLEAAGLTLFFNTSAEDLNTNTDLYISFGAAIEADIWDGGVNKKRVEANNISISIAKENLKDIKKSNIENNKILRAKINLLKEKISLLESNIFYDEKLLEREKDLESIGSSTSLNVEVVELDLLNIYRDLDNINGELYITILQLASISGYNIEDFI